MPSASPDFAAPSAPVVQSANPYAPYGSAPTVLSIPQIAGYCYAAGFRGSGLVTAIAVVLAESGGQTNAHNSYSQGGRTYDVWGLFQISTIHPTAAGVPVNEQTATDPLTNAKMAYDLSGGGINWQPWAGDGYSKFIGQATAAAGTAAAQAGQITTGGTVLTAADVSGADAPGGVVDPKLVTPTKTGASYPPVAKVWDVGDITVELVAADGTQLNLAGLKSIEVGGTGSTLEDLLVSVDVSLDNSQSTQVTLTFEQGDVIAAKGLGFPAQPDSLISKVKLRGMDLAVSSVSLVADAANRPQWQIVCISEPQMILMDAYPSVSQSGVDDVGNPVFMPGMEYAPGGYTITDPNSSASTTGVDPTDPSLNVGGESAAEYLYRICHKLNIAKVYAETANNPTLMDPSTTMANQPGTADMAGYNPYGNPASGTLPDSVWVYLQRLAGWFGFWFYEAQGAIWFAQPSILVGWGNKLHVNYRPLVGFSASSPVYPGNAKPDGTEPIGTPRVSANIEETPGGFARVNRRQITRQIEVDLAPWYGCQAKPGDELVLSGLGVAWDTNPDPPDNWKSVGYSSKEQWPRPGQKYIITSVNFKIDGGLSPVTVKAEEVRDPNPQLPNAGSQNGGVGSVLNGPNGGAYTTSYVMPQSVEAHLSANYRTGRYAADALKLAASQIGVSYQWGGISPQQGFDCSGLVYWACLQVGVDPTNQPRTAAQLWATIVGARRQVTVAQALTIPFALLFPADPASAPSHVAISMGDGRSVLQAPQTGEKVNISDISANGWLVQAGLLPSLIYLPPAGPVTTSPDSGHSMLA